MVCNQRDRLRFTRWHQQQYQLAESWCSCQRWVLQFCGDVCYSLEALTVWHWHLSQAVCAMRPALSLIETDGESGAWPQDPNAHSWLIHKHTRTHTHLSDCSNTYNCYKGYKNIRILLISNVLNGTSGTFHTFLVLWYQRCILAEIKDWGQDEVRVKMYACGFKLVRKQVKTD